MQPYYRDKTEVMYLYKAFIVSVYDGDTCRADIDLGFGVWLKNTKLRLASIQAPEINSPGGEDARDFLVRVVLRENVILETEKRPGKWGRWIATIWRCDGSVPAGPTVNERMVENGHAKWVLDFTE